MFEEHRKVGATGAYLPVRRISGTDKDGGELRWEGERGRDKGMSKGVGWRKSVLGRGDAHTAVKYFSAEPTHPLSTQPSHYSQWTEHRGK